MDTPIVWVTGASGLLGSAVLATAPTGISVVALRHTRALPDRLRARCVSERAVGLSNAGAVAEIFHHNPPSAVIHCAALTRGDLCEADPTVAYAANVKATENLVDLCRQPRIPLLHCSTDLVFDGQNGPYCEDDPRSPIGIYAETKARAEDIALAYDRSLVVRLPLMLGPSLAGDRSADEWLRTALENARPVCLFVDEYRTPIHTHLAAPIIWQLLEAGVRGIVHVAGATRVSRYELGLALAHRLNLPIASLKSGSLADFKGSPPRCPDVSLKTDRLTALIGRPSPTLEESLALPLAGE